MKVIVGIVSMFLISCAVGTEGGSDPPKDNIQVRPTLPDTPVPFFTDPKCLPVTPPIICNDFIAKDGLPYPILIQFSIECRAVGLRDDCRPWSLDPTYYSTDTWAYCCIPGDAGTFK